MTNPNASPAVWVNGILNVDVKGTIGGTSVNLGNWTTGCISISFSPFGGYRVSFGNCQASASQRTLSLLLPELQEPSFGDYYEYVVTEESVHAYDYVITSSSKVTVTKLNSSLYRYALDNLQLSAKARHGDQTRELTGSGFFLLEQLMWPL